jgi:predicted Zn-dependent protease
MGLFDKLDKLKEQVKGELAERAAKAAAKQSAELAKAAARKSADAAVAVATSAGRKLEEALFGPRDELTPSPSRDGDSEEARQRKADEIGERLRAADRRVKDRDAREAAAREAKRVKTERGPEASPKASRQPDGPVDVEDELAALKKKLDR